MSECDAPESNKTVAGTKLTGNVPNTTPGRLELVQLSRGSLCHVRNSVDPCWFENLHFHGAFEMMVVRTSDHCLFGESASHA
jgi:hypothetical protein